MRKGDIIDVSIENSGMNGEGVAKADGMVVFVPFTLKGEKARVKIVNVKKHFASARVIKILEASPSRINPDCNSYYKCGGCDMMHVDKDTERDIKISEIENNLRKIAGIDKSVDEFIESPQYFGYRNKAQFPFGIGSDGNVTVGYYKQNSHDFVECRSCMLVGGWINPVIEKVLKFANDNRISVYDETTHKGILRHLVVRRIDGQIAVITVINAQQLPNEEKFVKLFDNGEYLYLNENRKRTNVILGEKYKLLKGKFDIECNISGVKARLSPDSFMQINDNVRDLLYSDAVSEVKSGTVIDLYSGIGITTNLLADKADKAYSIEIVENACRNAAETARLNNNEKKIEVICGDAAVEMPKLARKLKGYCTHYMQLDDIYFDMTASGGKNYEARLYDEKRKSISVNDVIVFFSKSTGAKLRRKVTDIIISDNPDECYDILYESLNKTQCENSAIDKKRNEKQAESCLPDKRDFIGSLVDIYGEKLKNFKIAVYILSLASESELSNSISLRSNSSRGICRNGVDVLIDPPRKGCDETVLSSILKISPERIIYISCNHATLSRDIAYINKSSHNSYTLTELKAYNMFPRTHHVETLVCLSHQKPDSNINVTVEFGGGDGQLSLNKITEKAEARKPKERVTYKMIQEYVESKYGFKVHTAYIAEVKRSLGLPMYDAPNAVEVRTHEPQHPSPKMVEAIKDALKHFEIE